MTYNYPKTNTNLNKAYPNKLLEIGIGLCEDYKGSSKHHLMKCVKCGHEWTATPKSKIANFKIHGRKGCPDCTGKERYDKARKVNIQKLKKRGIEILSDNYSGTQRIEEGKYIKIKVKNTNCGHIFECSPANLLTRNVNCPICNAQRKREAFQQFNIDRQIEYQKTASAWNIYRHRVYQLTRQTYKEHLQTINPNNLMRGKAGVDGAYHLDHLVPVRYCFDNDIPSHICAHHTNLQMLHWNDNIGSRDKLKQNTPIPEILQEFINT